MMEAKTQIEGKTDRSSSKYKDVDSGARVASLQNSKRAGKQHVMQRWRERSNLEGCETGPRDWTPPVDATDLPPCFTHCAEDQ